MKPYKIEEMEDGVLVFTINRPEKHNAINYEVMDGLELAIQKMKDDSLKALVITGEGDKAFCSGGDVAEFRQLQSDTQAFSMLSRMSNILTKLLFLPKPTLALINGMALGGGCELASACDFRIARNGIKAGYIQGKLAITTGWGGGTILLEKINSASAMKLLVTAKPVDTQTLLELGYLDQVYEGSAFVACSEYIQKMLPLDTSVLQAYKNILIRKWESSDLQSRMLEEVLACSKLWAKEAHHEQVTKFLERK
jgi:enoyl-CoA hydratase/carnithine racemase